MQSLAIAITHQTISEDEQLRLLADRAVAIGTAIKGKSPTELTRREAIDVDLLDRLAAAGGFAVVTYGKDNQRWLCRFTPGAEVKTSRQLRSLGFTEMKELPLALRQINTMRSTIRELTGEDREAVLSEAARLKWIIQ